MPAKLPTWEELFSDKLAEWLLEGECWVVYRVLTDLMEKGAEDNRVATAQMATYGHPLIKKIFEAQNEEGYWGKPRDIHTWWPKKNTTFWILPVLADFGLTVADNRIARACEYVFTTQLESGGFGWDPPTKPAECHTAILAESLAKLGFLGDPRLQKAYNWLASRQRLDGAFWCKETGQASGPREKEPGCAFATTFVLGALVQNPDMKNTGTANEAIDFAFQCWNNRRKVKYAGHDSSIGTDWDRLKYPFTDYKILKFLDTVSMFDQARERLLESGIVELLLKKRNKNGMFKPESIIKVWSDFDFGQKKEPSRWITFLALRVFKRILK
ncbi:MAG: prenyltransferase/squalene oxidase repeat-containing protein [Promethearchaeati archaeon SRVP18_Atabeyarchaeia-1]